MKLTAIITTAVLQLAWLLSLTSNVATRPSLAQFNQSSITAELPLPQTSKTPPAKPNETEQDQVLRVETALVTVPVVAMDQHGRFVPDLQAKNFHVFEEGVEQEIAFFSSAEEPATIALLLDVSESTEFHLTSIQEASIAFVDQLHPQDRVMVVAFDSQTRIFTEPTNDHQAVRDAIHRTHTGRGTALYDTLDAIITERLNQIRGRKAIVLFTDGVDTGSQATLEGNLRLAEESDVFIYTIEYKAAANAAARMNLPSGAGIGSVVVSSPTYQGDTRRADVYLRELARKTGARFNLAESPKLLVKSFALIAEDLGKQYSLGYYPSAPTKPGQRRKIKVTVDRPKIVVRARESYLTASPRTEGKN